ncbi:uncharacterized protein [uncultured Mediterranean phage uvMED]|nr:uncharacterized protein [uncultured Mediterranean phage uvMED]
MSSELKITNLKHASSSSNNLVLASDGNVSITNTLSAGTIGSSVAGVMNLIHQETTSSNHTNWDVNNIFSTTYENYIVYLNIEITADGKVAYMRLLDGSGSQIDESYYQYAHDGWRSANGNLSYTDINSDGWHLARVVGSGDGESYNGTITFSGVNVDSRITCFRSLAVYGPNTGPYEVTHLSGGGNYGRADVASSVTQAVRGLRFFTNDNQIALGSKISVYGVR